MIGLPEVFPGDPKITLAEARAQFDLGRQEYLSQAQHRARLNLLADEPRIMLAREHLSHSQIEQSISLLEEARRLNPRSLETRLLLLQQYLLINHGVGIAQETSALFNLAPEGRAWYANLLAGLALNPLTSRDVIASMPSHPVQISVLEALAKNSAPIPVLFATSKNLYGRAKSPKSAGSWVSNIIMPLVQKGDIPQARQLWAHFYAVDGNNQNSPFDPEFMGFAGAPFGWATAGGTGGFTEIGNGSLELEYFGRKSAMLVQQLITLQPGNYGIHYVGRADRGSGLGLFWKIQCVEGEELLRSPIGLSVAPTTHQSPGFVVPPTGCTAQWLRLTGEPLIDARPVSASLESVTIRRM